MVIRENGEVFHISVQTEVHKADSPSKDIGCWSSFVKLYNIIFNSHL